MNNSAFATLLLVMLQFPHHEETAKISKGLKWPAAKSSYEQPSDEKEHNLTNEEMANAMRASGFNVRDFPGESPLVFLGDMAYFPEQILPKTPGSRQTPVLAGPKIWRANGVAESWYFFDTQTQADQKVFEAAVKTWSDTTCIQFHKLPAAPCSQKFDHGSICVGNYGGCWSMVGNLFKHSHSPQKMSVQPNGCELVAAAHEFGHALGFNHQQSRPDRDKFMFVKNENFKVPLDKSKQGKDLSGTWSQGGRCAKGQVVDLPVPYDYMSLMQYATAAFGDDDMRPIFVATDGHYQYMLDYHRNAGMVQSHYDLYSLNTVYGCDKVWAKSCGSNGKQPPKCQNLGYLNKDCACKCPKAFSGAACEKKAGPIFPRLAKAKTILEIAKSQKIDLSHHKFSPEKLDAVLDDFKYYQFVTIIAHGPDAKTQVSINVKQSADKFAKLQRSIGFIVQNIHEKDCSNGINLMWGLSKLGNLRTECLSSVANNEPDGPMFRSKSNHLDLIYRTHIGSAFSDPMLTVQFAQMKADVVFSPNPAKLLVTEKGKPGSGGNGTNDELDAPSSAPMSAPRTLTGIGIGIAVVMLLLLASLVAFIFVKKKQRPAEVADPDAPPSKDDDIDDHTTGSKSSSDESENENSSSDSEAT